jgi:hypothetical protein
MIFGRLRMFTNMARLWRFAIGDQCVRIVWPYETNWRKRTARTGAI